MGNKSSRGADEDRKVRKSSSLKSLPSSVDRKSSTARSNGADKNEPEVKIYRSKSTTDEIAKRRDDKAAAVDIRLYRRSTPVGDNPTTSGRAAGTQTLPRGFGRNRSSTTGSVASGRSDMTLTRPSVTDQRRTLTLSRMSMTAASKVQVEFPDTNTIIARLKNFQQLFIDRFIRLYTSLPDTIQLSILSVAIHRGQSPDHGPVSLWQYLHSSVDGLPSYLPPADFGLTITGQQMTDIQNAMRQGVDVLPVAQNVVGGIAAAAAAELVRIFEYQIVLVGDGMGANLLAEGAADSALDYLKTSSRHLDVNSLVHGAVRGRLPDPRTILSVIVGQMELKWNLADILRKPGLRRERLLVAGMVDAVGGYGIPWTYHASDTCESIVYGYRGQILLRDFGVDGGFYQVDVDDDAAFGADVPWRADDFHQTYRPYHRLIGAEVVESYSRLSGYQGSSTLARYVIRLQGDSYARDDVLPVCRPLTRRPTSGAVVPASASPSTFVRDCRQRWSMPHRQSTPVTSDGAWPRPEADRRPYATTNRMSVGTPTPVNTDGAWPRPETDRRPYATMNRMSVGPPTPVNSDGVSPRPEEDRRLYATTNRMSFGTPMLVNSADGAWPRPEGDRRPYATMNRMSVGPPTPVNSDGVSPRPEADGRLYATTNRMSVGTPTPVNTDGDWPRPESDRRPYATTTNRMSVGPPPPVKPKPNASFRSQSVSPYPEYTVNCSSSTTTTPSPRQLPASAQPTVIPEEDSDVIRFPTIAELFSKELKEIESRKRSSTSVSSEPKYDVNQNRDGPPYVAANGLPSPDTVFADDGGPRFNHVDHDDDADIRQVAPYDDSVTSGTMVVSNI